jgi:hypothetical protein
MSRGLFVALAASAILAAPAAATITTIDFNGETQNNVASLIYPGVTITSPGGTVFTSTFGTGPNGTRGVLGRADGLFAPLRADFTGPVNFVSVDIGDLGGDADNLFLRAFNASNVLLGSAAQLLPGGLSEMRTLSLAVGGIAYIEFGGVGLNGESNVYSDNLSFGTRGGAVPEPASWAMLIAGFGLVGALQRRRTAALA